ncbi:MAG: sporulation membrane protein YtaF [Clostridium sp.]
MLQALLLVFSLCLDSFVASIAYGTKKILIPFKSALTINLICSLTLLISLLLGSFLSEFIPSSLTSLCSFLLLFGLGVYRLFESLFKTYISKKTQTSSPLTFKLFDFKFVIEVYADETKADFDNSKTLSIKEAAYLATALSLDSLAVGFSYSLIKINPTQIVLLSFLVGMVLLFLGCKLGKKFSEMSSMNISWLSGFLLIVIAILRVI